MGAGRAQSSWAYSHLTNLGDGQQQGQSPSCLCHCTSGSFAQLAVYLTFWGWSYAIKSQVVSPLFVLSFGLSLCSGWKPPAWTLGINYTSLIGTLGLMLTSACRGGRGLGEEASKSPEQEHQPCPYLPSLVIQGSCALPRGTSLKHSQGRMPVYSANRAGSGCWILP